MKQIGKPSKKNHSLVSTILVTFVLLIGLSLLLYPTVADYINSLDYKKDIEDYRQEVRQLDDSARREMLAAAEDFNRRLLANATRIGELDAAQRGEYEKLLDLSGSGMMGYVEIEKVQIYLPIYHGTSESVLQAGVGHIEGSSLPVGGKGTHVILSGHTGLPSSKLFSNIDQLEIGDTFELHVWGETLTYQVESTAVLLPEEAEKQEIDPERDLCTLMTCTPYGVNSHRLLITGARIQTPDTEYSGNDAKEKEIPAPVPPVLWIVGVGLALILITAAVFAVHKRHKEAKPHRGGSDEAKG